MSQNLVDELGADLVLLNGKIVTVDPSETIAEAVAVKDGRFLKVGSSEEIRRLAGRKTRIIDLKGKTVLPGFIDSHEHCIRKGMRGDWVDCTSPPMATIDQPYDLRVERHGDDVVLLTGPTTGPEGNLLDRARQKSLNLKIIDSLQRAVQPAADWRAYCELRDELNRMHRARAARTP